MWTTSTIGRKMFLPILAVCIILTVSTGSRHVYPPCCDMGSKRVNGEIMECFEQKPGPLCNKHFYLVKIKGNELCCINPDSKWLQKKIQKEDLKCPPTYKPSRN